MNTLAHIVENIPTEKLTVMAPDKDSALEVKDKFPGIKVLTPQHTACDPRVQVLALHNIIGDYFATPVYRRVRINGGVVIEWEHMEDPK